MAKLTLGVDDEVIVRAKQYADSHGISVSKMVEAYLAAVAAAPPAETAPVLRAVRGILKTGDAEDYKRHLDAKYR